MCEVKNSDREVSIKIQFMNIQNMFLYFYISWPASLPLTLCAPRNTKQGSPEQQVAYTQYKETTKTVSR